MCSTQPQLLGVRELEMRLNPNQNRDCRMLQPRELRRNASIRHKDIIAIAERVYGADWRNPNQNAKE